MNVEAYDPPRAFIENAVSELVSDARAKGISRDEIEEDMGDLYDLIAQAYESRTDDEVERLASRDD